MTCYVMQR